MVSRFETRRKLHSLAIKNYTFCAVECFTYLGAEINSEIKVTDEIKRRIMGGHKTYYDLLSKVVQLDSFIKTDQK